MTSPFGSGPFGTAPFGGAVIDATGELPTAVETDAASTLTPLDVGELPTAGEMDLAIPIGPSAEAAVYDEAINDADRSPVLWLRADWNQVGRFDHPLSDLTEVVESVSVTRELAGALPAEVGIVEGYSAASLKATLAGWWGPSEVDPVDAFAPYKPTAALYRTPLIETPVELWTGFNTREGPQYSKRFTGSVSRVSPSAANREVQLDALDGANRLRAPIYQQAVGMDALLMAKYGPVRYFSRMNSQWLIDRILRANGVYASPPIVGQPDIAATMHGSTIPEIGGGGFPLEIAPGGAPSTTEPWISTGHPHGMLYSNPLAPQMGGMWTTERPFTAARGDAIQISLMVRLPTTPIDSPTIRTLIQIGYGKNGNVFVGVWNGRLAFGFFDFDGFTYGYYVSEEELPDNEEWVSFAGMATFINATTLRLNWEFRGNLYEVSSIPIPPRNLEWDAIGKVYYTTPVPFTNVQIRRGNLFVNAPDINWVPQATLDPGANEWYGIPDIAGEDSWSLLQEVVAAEFGACGFDEEGLFWFRSRARTRPRGTPERITSERTLADLVTTTDESAVRNHISATTVSYMVGPWEDIFEAQEIGQITAESPGSTIYDLQIDRDVCWVPDNPVPSVHYEDFNWKDSNETKFNYAVRYSVTDDLTKQQNVGGFNIYFELLLLEPGVLRLVITNFTGATVVFATPGLTADLDQVDPQPALKIPGRKLIPQPAVTTTVQDVGSMTTYGARAYDLGGVTRWRQHPNAVAEIAGSVLGSIGQPVPVLDAIDVPHDPRRKLLDPVVITDQEGLGEVAGTITGITTGYTSSGAARDQLTVRPLGPPGLGLFDDPQLGMVGTTLVFGA